MKRNIISRTIAFALVLALILCFTACGGSTTGARSYASASSAAPQASSFNSSMTGETMAVMDAAEGDFAGITVTEDGVSAPLSNRKIVKHVDLNMETMTFDETLAKIMEAIAQAGGYVESQSVDGQSMRNSSYYERNANVYARIPSESLGDITAELGELCNITNKGERIDDITDRYFDTDAHLKTLQLQEERLLEILSKADKLEDVITLEKALSETRYEIETLTAQLRRMDSQITYSYLNIYLNEVVEYSSIETAPKTFGEKISASFGRSVKKIASFFEDAVLFIIEDLPLLLIWLVLLGTVSFFGAKLMSRLFSSKSSKIKKGAAVKTEAKETDKPGDK